MSDSLILGRGHPVHFAKFPMLKSSKGCCSHRFIQFQPNFIVSMLVMTYLLLLFWLAAKIKNKKGTLTILLSQDHMGLEISKPYSSYSFDPI